MRYDAEFRDINDIMADIDSQIEHDRQAREHVIRAVRWSGLRV